MGLFYRLFDRDYRDYRKQERVFHRKLRKSVKKANLFDYGELNNMVEIWVNSMYEYYKRGANVWQDRIGSQTIIDQLAEVKAMFDEIHQLYIPGRSGEFRDVMIDTFGALIGYSFYKLMFILFNKKRKYAKIEL